MNKNEKISHRVFCPLYPDVIKKYILLDLFKILFSFIS